MNVKNTIKTIVPNGLKKSAQKLYYSLFCPQNTQMQRTYGEMNPDKKIYVIRPTANSVEGLMSLLLNVTRQLYYAEKKGYIPVVDFENYPTQYSWGGGTPIIMYGRIISRSRVQFH